VDWALLFLVGLVYDVLYVLWNHSVASDRIHRASVLSVAIAAIGMFGITKVVESHVMAVPQLCGVLAGTYLGMWLKRRLS
jgi:hypothetical protein